MQTEISQGNTRISIENNFYFAKAAINAIESKNPLVRAAQATGIVFASTAIGLANLPITLVEDVTKPDSVFGGYVRNSYKALKAELISNHDPASKLNVVVAGGIINTLTAPIVLATSLLVDPLK